MSLLFNSDPYLKHCEAKIIDANNGNLILDQTIFYPLGGGQPGDTGTFIMGDVKINISDTIKGGNHSEVLHVTKDQFSKNLVGEKIHCSIDWERRYQLMKMHTCLHILCALIDAPITGAQLNEVKGRIDFNVDPSLLDKEKIEKELNRIIEDGYPTKVKEISERELKNNPKLVRTMTVGPPVINDRIRILQIGTDDQIIDIQPCGGTHVKNTNEIGKVVVKKIENKGRQNRRIIIQFA